jgi:ethanolamine utilization protein EutP
MRLQGKEPQARKTQAAVYYPDFIDVPGEYLEVRSYYRALIMLACESYAIALLQAADDPLSLFPGGLARIFDKPVLGVVTKTDREGADVEKAKNILIEAGAKDVYMTSAIKGSGVDELGALLDQLREAAGGADG